MKLTRRDFIKVSTLTAGGAFPVLVSLFEELVTGPELSLFADADDELFNNRFEVHLVDNSLLNLHFYFINVEKKGRRLYSIEPARKSFVVVRLPQQHVSERGFYTNPDGSMIKSPIQAELSGYSFLSFQLKRKSDKKRRLTLDLTVEDLLDWNNEGKLTLVTLTEWLKSNDKESLGFTDCENIVQKEVALDAEIFTPSPSIKERYIPKSEVFNKYSRIVSQLIYQNPGSIDRFVPVSLLEIPNKLYIVPLIRNAKDNNNHEIETRRATFFDNPKLLKTDREGTFKYDIWNNRMSYLVERNLAESQSDSREKYKIEAPNFRIVGYSKAKYDPAITDLVQQICRSERPGQCDPTQQPPDTGFLPSLLTKAELSFLTQYAKSSDGKTDFTTSSFDLKELNGFFFTGLGVICHLKYYNLENRPVGHNLIEYEHIITQGRDVFIKVARLGVNCRTAQRYKYVQEAKRRITAEGVSFLELKDYCECIDKEIDYTKKEGNWQATELYKVSDLLTSAYKPDFSNLVKPVLQNEPHFRRYPFNKKVVIERGRIPIRKLAFVPKDNDEKILPRGPGDCGWFWPMREAAVKDDDSGCDMTLDKYLLCELDGDLSLDKDNRPIKPQGFPFIFIYASVFETHNKDIFTDIYNSLHRVKSGCKGYDERRNIYLSNQKIAFTNSIELVDAGSSKNQVNLIETDFLEPYFNVWRLNGKKIEDVPYALFPQLLKAKLYVDHIRDLTHQKIPSVIQYHNDYVDHAFDEYRRSANEVAGNGAKLILEHTNAFVSQNEERVNNTYSQITKALKDAKDKLGNLVTPDVIPDTISLDTYGITMPPAVKESIRKGTAVLGSVAGGIEKLQQFSPRELLRGKFSEIMGGIDLREILDAVIPMENTPLFEIKKLVERVDEIILLVDAQYQAILNEKLIKNVDLPPPNPPGPYSVNDIKKIVENLKTQIEDFEGKIADSELKIKNKLLQLSGIPNVDELGHIVKSTFEKYRIKALDLVNEQLSLEQFNSVKKTIEDHVPTIMKFLEPELRVLRDEFIGHKDEVESLFATVLDDIADIDAVQAIKNQIDSIPELRKAIRTDAVETLRGVETRYSQIFSDGQLFSARDETRPEVIKKNISDYLTRNVKDVFAKTFDEIDFSIDATQVYFDKAGYFQRSAASPFLASMASEPNFAFKILRDQNQSGYLQVKNKVEQLEFLIAKNISGNAFQRSVVGKIQADYIDKYVKRFDALKQNVADNVETTGKGLSKLSRDLKDWKRNIDNAVEEHSSDLLPATKDAVRKIEEKLVKLNPYIDHLRKVDPYFYYIEYQRIKKEVDDIKHRFTKDIQEIFGAVHGIESEINIQADNFNNEVKRYVSGSIKIEDLVKQKKEIFERIEKRILALVPADVRKLQNELQNLVTNAIELKKEFKRKGDELVAYVKGQGSYLEGSIVDVIDAYLERLSEELITTQNLNQIAEIQEKIDRAKNIYRLLTSIRQQDLTYTWNTTNFRDVNLGAISFKKSSNPETTLSVGVKASTYFTQGKFPPAIDRITTYSENKLTDFAVGFFNILTIGFSEVHFIAGSDRGTHFGIKIKDVKFDGSLAFVQKFESWLKTMGKGLILRLEGDGAILGYSLPIPAINTPAFSFFNLSLNFDLRLYFDKRPMRFGFSFARADSKFGIAAGIYAGFGFFSIVGEPKRGIVEVDCALEAGVWKGLSIGPMSGEVKLAFGFRYTRNDFGVRLEGYITAEGRLSVWIVEVSASIYLGVVSENSYVEGVCTVTYTVKVGFLEKSFSGTFHQTIAGAKSNNSSGNADKLVYFLKSLVSLFTTGGAHAFLSNREFLVKFQIACSKALDRLDDEEALVIETRPVSRKSWEKFIKVM